MSGFSYPPPIFNSGTYNSSFYLSLDPTGYLTYAYSQTLFLDKNDYRLSYVSGVSAGIAQSGIALVPDSSIGISGLGALSCSSLTVNGSPVGSSSYIVGITPGTAQASKALVLDAAGSIATITSLTATSLSGTLQTGAQPNITSVGTLTSLPCSGNISGTLSTGGQPNITSVGTLTSLSCSGSISGTLSSASQPNITSLGTLTSLSVSGNLTFSGASRAISGLSTLSSTSISGTLATASQPNITSIGTLSALTVSASSADSLALINTSGSTSATLSFNSGTYYSSLGLRSNSDVLGESNCFIVRMNSIDAISINAGASIGLGGYSPSPSFAVRCGSLSCDSLAIGSTTYDFSTLGGTAGSATASKGMVVDSNRDISNINSLTSTKLTGTLQTAAQPNITSIQSLKMASGQLMFGTTTPYTSGTYGTAPVTLQGGNMYVKTTNGLNDGSSAWDMVMYLESSNAIPVSFAFQINNSTAATSTNSGVMGTVSNSDFRMMTNNGTKAIITAAGRLGVATTTPSAMLHVASSVSTSVAIAAPYANGTSTSWSTGSGTVNDSVGIRCDNALSVGTRGIYVSSDRRVKQDIKSIELARALDFIDQVDPKIYSLRAEPERQQLGYIAQDVIEFDCGLCGAIPNIEMISDDEAGFTPVGIQLTVSYERVIPLLHVALRDALHQIDELRQRFSKQ